MGLSSRRRALGMALTVGVLAALLVVISRRAPSKGQMGSEPNHGASVAEAERGDLLATPNGFDPEAGSRSLAGPSVGPTHSQEEEVATDRLDALLGRLREIAAAHDYHDQAWSILESIAALPSSALSERLTKVARGAELDVDQVRAGCLVALALRGSEVAASIGDEFILSSSPELERAGWIGHGLLASGGGGLRIELLRFRGPAALRTFPATVSRESGGPIIDRAIARLQQLVSPDVMAVSTEPDGNKPRLEEQFTRSVVVLAILAPSAGHSGHVRDTLLRWLRGAAPQAWLADDAVLHSLALAAKGDEELAAELLSLAAARLFEPEGTGILEALVRLGEQHALVLDHLRGFFASEKSIEGDSLHLLTQVQAIAALMPLLAAEDASLREEASQLVMERLLDPDLDPTERLLFLNTLATRRSDLVLEAVEALVHQGAAEEVIADAIIVLNSAPPEQRQDSQALLVALLGREGLGQSTRMAIMKEIAQLGADGSRDLLGNLRAIETDPTVIAYLDSLSR